MEEYLIGTLAKKLGVHKETIRYYERINLIKYDKKGMNSYRYYSESTYLTLKFILEIKKYGFSLKEIRSIVSIILKGLNKEDIDSVISLLTNKLDTLEIAISKMLNMKIVLNNLLQEIKGGTIKDCNSLDCPMNNMSDILSFIETK